MSWHSKKLKRELWILPLLTANEPGQTFSRARMTYVLKALEGPKEDGSVVKKVSDGDIWIKAVFPFEAVSACFQGESQEESWDRSLILIKKYHVTHEVNKGAHEFQLVITEFSFWESQEGFALKSNPVYCMEVPEVQRKVDSIIKEKEKSDKCSEGLSMSSIALSDLLDQMSPTEDSQSAVVPKTPTKINSSKSSGQSSSLPDSPPLLNPDILLNELCVINSQERQQLDEIEEWKEDYVPAKMNDSSSDSMESSTSGKKDSRRSAEFSKSSQKLREGSSPKNVLKLHKRTLDTADSSGEFGAPAEKIRKTTELCNGDIDGIEHSRGKCVQSTSVQVGNSLFVNSQASDLGNKQDADRVQLVSASAQVGDSLQMLDSHIPSNRDTEPKSQETIMDKNDSGVKCTQLSRTIENSKDCDKDRNSNNLTPIIETQAQRVPSSDESNLTSGSKDIITQESRYSGLPLDTIVQPTQKQPAKNIGDYQDRIDLSCSVNDVSSVEAMETVEKGDQEIGAGDGSTSPDRYQSTQKPDGEDQVHRPDFPVSPVPRLAESQRADTITLPEGEMSSPRRTSTDDRGETERDKKLDESTPKEQKEKDAALCVGGYFSAGISPPLVMPSTSHTMGGGPTSPKEFHSPLHPPARPSTSNYTPLLKKSSSRKLSPTRRSPSKTVQLPAVPSTSQGEGVKRGTPAQKERWETLEEELRLAMLSGRNDLRKSIEDDAQSVSSVGTVQLAHGGRELDIDPMAIDEDEKKIPELRKAASGIEIIEVRMKDISPKDRKMQRRPTLEIVALSPKKLNKFSSPRSQSSSDSDGNSVSSSSSQQLKTFSIGKRRNTLDVSLKIIDEVEGKRPSLPVKISKAKTPAKRRGDISVLFSSPDRLKKSVSDPTPLSPDGSMLRKKRRIRLYKETMLMPVDEDASQKSGSQGSSGSQSTDVQSTPDSELLLISNTSSEPESQKAQKKGKVSKKSTEVNSRGNKKATSKSRSATDAASNDFGDLVTPMTREERQKYKEQFLTKSRDNLSPTLTKKLKVSPRVQLPDKSENRLTPSYSLTAGQRSRRRSKTPDMEMNSESDWTLPFTPAEVVTKPSGRADQPARVADDVTSILMQVAGICEEDVTDTQMQLLNVPLSLELSEALDNYLVLPKFAASS